MMGKCYPSMHLLSWSVRIKARGKRSSVLRCKTIMTTSNQWSLFTVFVIVTLTAVIAATMNWFGAEPVVVVLMAMVVLLSMFVLVRFLLHMSGTALRRHIKQSQHDYVMATLVPAKPKRKEVDIVIAAAENGLVNEPNSSIRYLDPPVNDHTIADLTDCSELKWLVLDNTDVSDAGLVFLHGMTKLRRIYIRGSRVTAAGVAQLKDALPNATILY